ncbi:unnamed protein product [Schistosoma margrebowiei]|uniref:Uncharacterized protein n=1 Tax=Schistosoma margrebowiei TaxID=48269 RepID=A0A3P7Z9F1_9TREM|nr:unnamed protein product [Schistosoma margrebowiei]
MCINDNCSINNTTGSIDINCDNFEQHSCDKHSQDDYPDNLPVKTDDIIMKMSISLGVLNHAHGVYPPHHDILEFVSYVIRNKFVFCAFHFQQSGRSDEEVKELIFNYIEELGAREDQKFMMDPVFDFYTRIKNVRELTMVCQLLFTVIQQKTVVGEATHVSVEDLKKICPLIDWKFLFENAYMNESYNKLEVIVQDKEALQKTCVALKDQTVFYDSPR